MGNELGTTREDLAAELISPNAIFYVAGHFEPLRGPAGYLTTIKMMRAAFPDIQWTMEEMIAEGEEFLPNI